MVEAMVSGEAPRVKPHRVKPHRERRAEGADAPHLSRTSDSRVECEAHLDGRHAGTPTHGIRAARMGEPSRWSCAMWCVADRCLLSLVRHAHGHAWRHASSRHDRAQQRASRCAEASACDDHDAGPDAYATPDTRRLGERAAAFETKEKRRDSHSESRCCITLITFPRAGSKARATWRRRWCQRLRLPPTRTTLRRTRFP